MALRLMREVDGFKVNMQNNFHNKDCVEGKPHAEI